MYGDSPTRIEILEVVSSHSIETTHSADENDVLGLDITDLRLLIGEGDDLVRHVLKAARLDLLPVAITRFSIISISDQWRERNREGSTCLLELPTRAPCRPSRSGSSLKVGREVVDVVG